MRRRTFLKGLGASGALVFGGHGAQATFPAYVYTNQELTCVVDRLPAIKEKRARARQPGESEHIRELLHLHEDFRTYPLIMGFGRRAEHIIARYPLRFEVPEDGALYHAGTPSPHETTAGLTSRLQATDVAILLIDGNDPGAVSQAVAWAERLATTDVFLRAAVLMKQDRPGDAMEGFRVLKCPVIEVVTEPVNGLDAVTVVEALLPGLSDFSGTLTCCDRHDIPKILQVGSRAQTQAVAWTRPTTLQATDLAIRYLGQQPVRGIIGWLNTNLDVALHEIEDVAETVINTLDTEGMEFPFPLFCFVLHPGWTKDKRVLSLTTVQ